LGKVEYGILKGEEGGFVDVVGERGGEGGRGGRGGGRGVKPGGGRRGGRSGRVKQGVGAVWWG